MSSTNPSSSASQEAASSTSSMSSGRCCVPNCPSRGQRTVKYHLIMREREVSWKAAILAHAASASFPTTTKVCSLHFNVADYSSGGKLRRGAVPTVFNSNTSAGNQAGNGVTSNVTVNIEGQQEVTITIRNRMAGLLEENRRLKEENRRLLEENEELKRQLRERSLH